MLIYVRPSVVAPPQAEEKKRLSPSPPSSSLFTFFSLDLCPLISHLRGGAMGGGGGGTGMIRPHTSRFFFFFSLRVREREGVLFFLLLPFPPSPVKYLFASVMCLCTTVHCGGRPSGKEEGFFSCSSRSLVQVVRIFTGVILIMRPMMLRNGPDVSIGWKERGGEKGVRQLSSFPSTKATGHLTYFWENISIVAFVSGTRKLDSRWLRFQTLKNRLKLKEKD